MELTKSNYINWLIVCDRWLWAYFLAFFLVFVSIVLTVRLRGMQFRYLPYALKLAFTRKDDTAEGDISQFQSLMTALSATIGIGSIAGVATAIMAGGFGAIFWMWVVSLFGMATKYAEAILAVKFRKQDSQGSMAGGPMYYIQRGLNWKFLATIFACFGVLSSLAGGNIIQANSIVVAVKDLYPISSTSIGVTLALMTFFILVGGIKSIGKVSTVFVPTMALLYVMGGLAIIFFNLDALPGCLSIIFKGAFTGQAAKGGFLGAGVLAAVQMGVARGVSSNEAGLGSAPIAAAAAKTDLPGRQALISMTGVFLSSIIVCSITALAIGVTGVFGKTNSEGAILNGVQLVMAAYERVIPHGHVIVAIGVILFGYTTIVGWAYYGEKCIEFIAGRRSLLIFRVLFSCCVFLGAIMSFDVVWPLADIMNGMMALPNLIALLCLSSIVVNESKVFFIQLQTEKALSIARC